MNKISEHIRRETAKAAIKRFQQPKPKVKEERVSRRFEGAQKTRMFADWLAQRKTTNEDIYDSQPTLLDRGRDKAKNSSGIKKFLDMCEKNIVYTGFMLSSLVTDDNGTPDEVARRAIETAWKEWGKKGTCTIDGMFSFSQAHKKLVRDKARDGEYLVREHYGSAQNVGNKYGYALQIIPVEALDLTYNQRLNNGNVIIMGVELNKWNRPVAYHILKEIPDDPFRRNDGATYERQRIPAEEIIHSFKYDFENQARGIPWAYAIFTDLHQYDNWQEAVVIAKRIAACTSAYYETPDDWDEKDIEAFNPPATTEPGTSEVGKPGVKKQILSTPQSDEAIQDTQRAFKRDQATGLDIAYHTYANDLENVNFSSIRAGVLDERDGWVMRQEDEKDDFLHRVFMRWLEYALLNGAIMTPNGRSLPAVKYEKFAVHHFQGRRWPWVDPVKDANANVIMRDESWKTDQQITSEMGGDFIDNTTMHAEANQMRIDKGLTAEPQEEGGNDE